MFFIFIFLSVQMISTKIIKNINIPSCINCIHCKPNFGYEYSSVFSKCDYFGIKNIQTDIISYDYANICRDSEYKCGLEGKYFIENKNNGLKIFLHNCINKSPLTLYIIIIIIIIYRES
jgi:hypothetical protein